MRVCLAIDIGASSGRHIVGYLEDDKIVTEEIYRFENGMDEREGHLVWDTERLFSEIKEGIRRVLLKYPTLYSLSIDTWGVDYVLMKEGTEVMPVYAYRDSRTEGAIKAVHSIIPFAELYERTGVQYNSFNTVYQLYADKLSSRLDGVTDFLMMPEYLMYKLTGIKCKEYTDATTTGLVSAQSGRFDLEIFNKLGISERLAGELFMPGHIVGALSPEVAREVGGAPLVVLCATHDTASAVEAIEMRKNAPFISSGTWSLFGVKTEKPLTDDKSRESGYSNEGGVGYNRYLKNIIGMWIIQSLRRELCPDSSYSDIAKMAEQSGYSEIFDVNDERFMAPESMSAAISEYFCEKGKPVPGCAADYFNSAYLSLAEGYRTAVIDLEKNTGKAYTELYIVGGGAKNGYLNMLTERSTGKRVVALPIEATAIGNLKIQLGEG